MGKAQGGITFLRQSTFRHGPARRGSLVCLCSRRGGVARTCLREPSGGGHRPRREHGGNALGRRKATRTRRRISVAMQSIGLVAPESTPVERKALALLLRQRETSLAETGINRVSFDWHKLSNGLGHHSRLTP